MRYIPLVLILSTSICFATPMKGFGARYYDEDNETSLPTYYTDKELIPNVIIGNNQYSMEASTLTDISNYAGVAINNDDQAAWICLKSQGIDYWFISDNEMGQGNLTAIAIGKRGEGCVLYAGNLSVRIKNTPLLGAATEKVSSYFNIAPKKDVIMYCKDTSVSDEYTIGNCVQYYLKNEKVEGVFISQLTTS